MRVWDEVVGHMARRRVIADLWFYSDDSRKYLPAAFSPEEDLYFRYVIARFGAFWNVTWNLALEFSEYRTREWVESRARFVKLHDPYDRILGVHQTPAKVYAFPGNPDLDRTSLQNSKLSNDGFRDLVIENRRMTASAGRPVPIVNDEYYLEGIFMDQRRGRQATWVMLVSGAAGYRLGRLGILDLPDWRSQEHFRVTEVAIPWLEEKVRFWAIEPAPERVDPGATAVRSCSGPPQFLVFSTGRERAPGHVGHLGRFSVEWLDPRRACDRMRPTWGVPTSSWRIPSGGGGRAAPVREIGRKSLSARAVGCVYSRSASPEQLVGSWGKAMPGREERAAWSPRSLSIVVPVFNEEENAAPLVRSIEEAVRPLGLLRIVVVDDGSSDGTGSTLRSSASRHRSLW
jgi:hypothetical protein